MRTNQEYHNLMKSEASGITYTSSFTIDSSLITEGNIFKIPFSGTGNNNQSMLKYRIGILTIDWGDGTSITITDLINLPGIQHTYIKNTGNYEIKISSTKGGMPSLCVNSIPTDLTNDWYNTLISVNNPLLTCITFNNVSSFASEMFMGCKSLSSIPSDLFINNPGFNTFSYCFNGCTSLTAIPKDLFRYNINANIFYECFSSCTSLTTIPTDLFRYNTLANNFGGCFYNCTSLTTIPTDLFMYNTSLTTLYSNGYNDVHIYHGCFQNCTSLTTIPTDLFMYNTSVTNFGACFKDCTSLTTIPTDLFRYNINVTSFSLTTDYSNANNGCFQNCTSLTTIPTDLFRYNTNATNFYACFENCFKLTLNTDIFCDSATEKATRFAGKSVNFNFCFLCNGTFTGTQGTAPDLWNYTFGSKTSEYCFHGHSTTSLTNYNDIPTAWK